MCTVTYLPTDKDSYLLTSNRDEGTTRPAAISPKQYSINGKNILFPKDPLGGGTWIAYAEHRAACLLNGGFEKHIPSPPYKKSRGLVLLDYFSFADATDFATHYDFTGIEPFTLVIAETNGLSEIRWTGKGHRSAALDPTLPHIWSSATLYTRETISLRQHWFRHWLEAQEGKERYTVESIRHFHRNAGEGRKESDLVMSLEGMVRTVSITTLVKKGEAVEMIYEELPEEGRF